MPRLRRSGDHRRHGGPVHSIAKTIIGLGLILSVLYGAGRGTAEDTVPIYVSAANVNEHITTIHAPDDGNLERLTYDVGVAGAGDPGDEIVFAITREVPDAGHEVLCSVAVPCTAPVESHIHPDGGTCGEVFVTEDTHLKAEAISNGCGLMPKGFLTGYFRWN